RLHFRVALDPKSGYAVQKEGSSPFLPPPPTVAPNRKVELGPTGSYPPPVTMRPGDPPSSQDSTMLGKPVAPINGHAPPPPADAAPAASLGATSSKGNAIAFALLAVVVGVGLAVLGYQFFHGKVSNAAPAAPVSLGKYGGIEIGSTGVKRVAVEYFQTDEGVKEVLLDELDFNPRLGDVKGAPEFNPVALKDTLAGVGDYYDALTKMGVPAGNVYVGCSSGVLEPFSDEAVRQRNHDVLFKAVREKTGGLEPVFIEAHNEAMYGFQLVVPKSEWADAVLIDVGGNNIKGGGFIRGTFRDFTVPAGSSSFEKKVSEARAKDEAFAAAAQRLSEKEIGAPLDAELGSKIELKERKKVYLLGGLPWALATYTHPVEFYNGAAEGQYYCRLDLGTDLDLFGRMVRGEKPDAIRAEVLAKAAAQKKDVIDALTDNVNKIQKDVFQKQDRLVGGAEMLAILDGRFAMRAENKGVCVFRYGQVAWLLRFVQERSGHLIDTKSPNS
ncbi:MAG TPA: hypothetical protein VMS17_19805, partial [Gemmataceae bacterium]|nr:hypothetical protein [Gemmataceae bacterium]